MSAVSHPLPRIAGRLLPVAICMLVSACGGSDSAASTPTTATTATTSLPRGTLLQSTSSLYPRLVRLAHQSDPSRNGLIVASVTEFAGGAGSGRAGFHASRDDGASFSRVATLIDDAFATGICCGTLFEMPQAVGTIPAGTLLYAASVGADVAGTPMRQPIFRSDDGGASFRRLGDASCGAAAIARDSAIGSGVWEPEFLIAGDGSLACIYSDETEPGKSQVLKLTRSRDGIAWSAAEVIVAGAQASDRPGMAVVRKLPGGRYAMSFESCSTARLDCSVWLKLSDDGLHWGPLGTLGTRPQTARGQYLRHAPTLAWAGPGARTDGSLALIGQIVAAADDSVDPASNGRVLFLNDADGAGDWRAVAAPIGPPLAPLTTNPCQNYSTPLLPSLDGARILLMQTDSSASSGCTARFGQGSLTP